MLKLRRGKDELAIEARNFSVYYREQNPDYLTIRFKTFQQDFFIPASCDSPTERDLTIARKEFSYAESDGICACSFEYRSTLWTKVYHLDVYTNHMEFYYDLHGTNTIDTLRFFEGTSQAEYVEHFYLTKHFNDNKTTAYREYSRTSPAQFKKVFNPEPNTYSKQVFDFFEYSQISANSDLDYCGGNFVFNPGLLCFLISAEPMSEWVSMGLSVSAGEYYFSEYEYMGGSGFGLNLNYWGAFKVEGHFRTPKLVIKTGETPEKALSGYVATLIEGGSISFAPRISEPWWLGPIVCGWGHQCYKADLFRVRSPLERPKDNAAYMMCTQAHYREFVEALDKHELDWKILIIDARWTISAGLKEVDTGRWQDMRGFVRELHQRGKRVLIWWGLWDVEGLSPDECITYSTAAAPSKVNRPGRLSKFGNFKEGDKLAPDPTLEPFRARIAERIRLLLGQGPDGFDLDGLKIDHVAAVPGMYGLKFPFGSARLYGIELLKFYQKFIYDAAKSVKPQALIIGQSAHPYFADCTDMLRLGDLYPSGRSVIEQMKFRAEMAHIACPHWLLDMDNWPLPSMQSLHDYMAIQSSFGVPSLYYATHLDTTGEEIPAEEFQHIRYLWKQYTDSLNVKK